MIGQILHGSGTTTHAVRAAIQRSKASISQVARHYHVNPKTIQIWRKRESIEDRSMGPRNAHSTVLSTEEEAACCLSKAYPAGSG
ncbi:MAG: helix-turn-helix domain-containing protein [Proteobacteria bacterium]|nr:helix-turn-helix domain-containing protein [Pseudomonadota bacterium]